jgi:hypothetical protein
LPAGPPPRHPLNPLRVPRGGIGQALCVRIVARAQHTMPAAAFPTDVTPSPVGVHTRITYSVGCGLFYCPFGGCFGIGGCACAPQAKAGQPPNKGELNMIAMLLTRRTEDGVSVVTPIATRLSRSQLLVEPASFSLWHFVLFSFAHTFAPFVAAATGAAVPSFCVFSRTTLSAQSGARRWCAWRTRAPPQAGSTSRPTSSSSSSSSPATS